jgi:hypothetical protein
MGRLFRADLNCAMALRGKARGAAPCFTASGGRSDGTRETYGTSSESPVASGMLLGVRRTRLVRGDEEAVTGGFPAALTRSPVFSCLEEEARLRQCEESQRTSGEVPELREAYSLNKVRVLGSLR